MVYKFVGSPKDGTPLLDLLKNYVEDGTTWASDVTTFNDLSEFKFGIDWEADEATLRETFFASNPGRDEDDYAAWRDSLEDENTRWYRDQQGRAGLLLSFGVTCFTTAPYDDLLMWAHYASNHEGFCVGIDPSCLRALEAHVASGPVIYQDEVPKVNPATASAEDVAKAAFFHKAQAWSHEREFRAVFSKHGPVELPRKALKEVMLGCRSEGLYQYARESLGANEVAWYQMTEDFEAYPLVRQPVERDVMYMTTHH